VDHAPSGVTRLRFAPVDPGKDYASVAPIGVIVPRIERIQLRSKSLSTATSNADVIALLCRARRYLRALAELA